MKDYIKPEIKVRSTAEEPLLNVASLPIIDDTIDDGDDILSNENSFDTTWDD